MTSEKVIVYELAKELGMDSIALIDKLKELKIDVKSHMSSLGEEEIKTIREHFEKEKAQKTKTKRKTTKPVADAKKVTSTVIRRRTKSGDDGEQETTVTQRRVITRSKSGKVQEVKAEIVSPPPSEPELENVGAQEPVNEVSAIEENTSTQTTLVASSTPETTPTTTAASPTEIVSETITVQKTENLGSGLKLPSLLGAKSDGKTIPKPGSILKIIQEEPFKKPLPPKISPKDPTGAKPAITIGQPSGPRVINLGKEAIDKLVEEEQVFKKKSGVGKPEREKEPLDVKVADYRAKKELVFLPRKKKLPVHKELKSTQITTPAAHKRIIRIENTTTVSDLAQRMSIKSGELIKKLMGMGIMATLNHGLDIDTATLLASEYGFELENVAFQETTVIQKSEDQDSDLSARPPIVTVMGHVDHGKTSLLDAIRSANVAAGEAGGITQHIGAYTVMCEGKKVTFIDTPGHEAFTVMRARGANVTDLVVLVVAADDGVMPQTREAIDHARAANVPIIVAINKVDKPGANPDKVTQGLAELNLVPEAWGGENIFVHVSALKRTGIKELLESILLQAEMLDLKANPNRAAEGSVLEAKLDRSRGPLVNVIVKKGTLHTGDTVVAGSYYGKVRALTSDRGEVLKTVGPSEAVEILGFEGVPTAGDQFHVLPEEEAKELAKHRQQKQRAEAIIPKAGKMSLEELFSKVQQGEVKELPVVLKSDVFGSAEAIRDSLSKIATEKVKVKILHTSTGGITESDVMLAAASNAIILGFNVRPETKALQLAEEEKVDVKNYTIIYELISDVKKAMAGLLDKKAVEKYLGRAEVRETFSVPKIGVIAGCGVVDGKILRGCQVRLLRDNRIIYTGKLSSLKRFKDDAKEVAQGYECGMGIENFNDIKTGDTIEAFMIEMTEQDMGTAIGSVAPAKEATQ